MRSSKSTLPDSPVAAREWRFVWLVTVAVLGLTSLPYVYGYLSTPPGKQFMGLALDVPDYGQYLSWWRGFQTAFLVRNTLTPEPNQPLFFNLLWWVLAQISRLTGLDYAPVYQAFRWAAGGFALWAVYRFVALFLAQVRERRTAFLLVALGSGLGWVLVGLKYTLAGGQLLYPLDLYVAEGNLFLCILAYPHFALALGLILLTLEAVWRGWQAASLKPMVVAGLLAFVLGWTHNYDLLIVYSVAGVFGVLVWAKDRVFPRRFFWGGIVLAVLSVSGAVYAVALTRLDPLWKDVLAQFANAGVYTPPVPQLFILFGLPLAAAVAAWLWLAWRRQVSYENLFLMGWFVTGGLLTYIPADYQIHMLNSWQVPMVILGVKWLYEVAAPGLARWRPAWGNRAAGWLSAALVLAVLPTNAYLWSWRFYDLSRHAYDYYLSNDEVAALDWLRTASPAQDVVLSSLTIGQYVPALGDKTAFLAHWAQTVHFYDKQAQVAHFFAGTASDADRLQLVRQFHVKYVFDGPAERALGAYDPATTPWLEPAFTTPQVAVYRVKSN
jgi:hypothetical protein